MCQSNLNTYTSNSRLFFKKKKEELWFSRRPCLAFSFSLSVCAFSLVPLPIDKQRIRPVGVCDTQYLYHCWLQLIAADGFFSSLKKQCCFGCPSVLFVLHALVIFTKVYHCIRRLLGRCLHEIHTRNILSAFFFLYVCRFFLCLCISCMIVH